MESAFPSPVVSTIETHFLGGNIFLTNNVGIRNDIMHQLFSYISLFSKSILVFNFNPLKKNILILSSLFRIA